jgi:hypothetical protein
MARRRRLRWIVVVFAMFAAGIVSNACGHRHNGNGPDGGPYVPDGGTCPTYQINCNNTCTNTSDPMNCGACGHTCPTGMVCSAGGCAANCLVGLDKCNGTCVDFQSDNNNCHACGNACPSGQGCVAGACVPAQTFQPPPMCMNGGGSNIVGSGSNAQCAGGIGGTSFTWSVCACNNATASSEVYMDGWNSANGTYVMGMLGGGLGADNTINGDTLTIYGAMWASGSAGTAIMTQSASHIFDTLKSGASIDVSDLTVSHDAYVRGNIVGNMTVGGMLHQGAGVTVPPPCDCTNKIDVVGIVAAGKVTNDNAAIGLDSGFFTAPNRPARIDLPCGEYYLKGASLSGSTTIVAHGHTVIFIDGSLSASQFLSIDVADSTSTLDMFVSNTITSTGTIRIGNPNYPALTRVYLGTTGSFELSSEILISGNIWVGYGTVLWTSDLDMFGAVFSNDFQVQAPMRLHYDQAVVNAGSGCAPPIRCTSCSDCNNQACNSGTCGACTTDADCCAPLTCNMGKCEPFIP